jgi:cell division protein FtsQ
VKFDKHIWLKRLRLAGIVFLWMLLLTGMVMSLAFINKAHDEIACSKIVVHIQPEKELLFIDRETVIRSMRADGDENKLLGKKITELNLPGLEVLLEQNKLIKAAEVFTDMNGIVHIHIAQREPILRIVNNEGDSYYLDQQGGKMPISTAFTARVPVASGNIFEGYRNRDSIESFVLRELFKIATYVDKDAFWKAQIEQIFVTAESELILVPKVGNHTIYFGNTDDMEAKFNKLMVFYKEALSRVGWDKYNSIDLRFRNQIVCKKKN